MYKYVSMLKSCLNSTFTVPLCVNLLCQGAEEKDGVGECSCDTEYQGVSCQECTKGYYNESDSCLGEDAIAIPLSLIYAYLIAPKLSPTSPQLLFTLSFPFSPPIAHLLPSTHLPSTSPPLLCHLLPCTCLLPSIHLSSTSPPLFCHLLLCTRLLPSAHLLSPHSSTPSQLVTRLARILAMAWVRVSVSSVQEAMRRTRKESAQVSEGVGRGGGGGWGQ